MDGSGEEHPTVVFVGEAPGRNEDEQGIPFVGESGTLLRRMVEIANGEEWPVYYTNAVRCRPLNNKTPEAGTIRKCNWHLREELKRLNPDIVVPLGSVALKACLDVKSIKRARGRKIVKDGTIFFPTWHPSFVKRNKLKEGKSPVEKEFIEDLSALFDPSIFEEANADIKTVTLQEAYNYLKQFPAWAFDLETNTKDMFRKDAKILCCSFSAEDDKALVVDLQLTRDSDSEEDLEKIAWLRKIFALDAEQIAQNGMFDCQFLFVLLNIWCEHWTWDTMYLCYTDDEKAPLGLKAQTAKYIPKYAGYEQELHQQLKVKEDDVEFVIGGYEGVDIAILHKYCGMDSVVAFLMWKYWLKKLEETGADDDGVCWGTGVSRLDYYRNVLHPCIITLLRMQINGCHIDIDRAQTIQEKLEAEVAVAKKTLWNFSAIKKFEKENGELNLNSSRQKAELLFKFQHLKAKKFTKGKAPAVDAETLKLLHDPLADALINFSQLRKLQTTYSGEALKEWIRDDDLVHSSFGFFAANGRLTSSNPNLQNIPNPKLKKGKDFNIRSLFTSRFDGGEIISADYKQFELRVFAIFTECEMLMRVFRKGGDPHRLVAAKIKGCKLEEVADGEREDAKRVNFGVLYGEGAEGLDERHGKGVQYWRDYITDWTKAVPEIIEYRKIIKFELRTKGFIEAPSGARRYFPDYSRASKKDQAGMERQAGNHPVANAANVINLISGNRVVAYLLKHNYRTLLINFIHDCNLFDNHPSDPETLFLHIKYIMEHPNIQWLTLPTPVDISCGKSWGEAVEI